MIGLENSLHILNQSAAKPKQIATYVARFPGLNSDISIEALNCNNDTDGFHSVMRNTPLQNGSYA